ncbi:MAG: TSUP family transporter [Lentilactobacillus diolivorans]|uniref:sulfite exporter TauE/SafE family protein n=1 Tax=Lentilactobacillus diolivorans TaxID=179838 RepID=UPI000FF51D4F|nr:TSUP family transporter [Lentilactobacillus diolivorans]RRG02982.1 MAG: sulfite exporter TauE/SafE family protein [Lactobacillus sp.]
MLHEFLIVCPLVFLAGFVDAIAGGGGLISLPAYLMAGLPAHFAVGTNKLSSAMGTVISTAEFARSGYIRVKLAFFSVLAAIIGSTIGAHIALHISDTYFRLILLIVLPATAGYLLLNRHALNSKLADSTKLKIHQFILTLIISLCLGVYDGFYGPGTGTFLILLLTGVAHLPINLAAGNTKVINLTTNVTALVVFLLSGKVIMLLGLTAGVFSVAANFLGAAYYKRYGSKIARPIIIVVLLIFFGKVIWDFIS